MSSTGGDFPEESPVPHIAHIEQTGITKITFSQSIHVLPNLDMLKSGTFENRDRKEEAVFTLEVIPGQDSDATKLGFTWNVIEMTERQILIQMSF